jgi:hypothetical protein
MTLPYATSTIVAQAFGMVELSPPSSFADDTPQAADATAYYPQALDICLELVDWGFASRMVALSETALPEGAIADPDLPYVFRLPGDCIALREVKLRGAKYRLDETILRCDQPAPLPIRYTRRLSNEAALPATFRTLVALQLAVYLAPRWLGVEAKRQALQDNLTNARATAARVDARTASPEAYGESGATDWVAEALR